MIKHEKWSYAKMVDYTHLVQVFVTPGKLREAARFLEDEAEIVGVGEHVPEWVFRYSARESGQPNIEVRLVYQSAVEQQFWEDEPKKEEKGNG